MKVLEQDRSRSFSGDRTEDHNHNSARNDLNMISSTSPMLFLLFMEPTAQTICQSKEMTPISLKSTDHFMLLFEDDILLYNESQFVPKLTEDHR